MSLNQNILWFLFDSLFQIPETIWENTEEFVLYIQLGAIQKVHFLRGREGGHGKANKNQQGQEVLSYIFKMKFDSYSPGFPIDYNGSMKY